MRLRNNPHAIEKLQRYSDIVIFKAQQNKGSWHEHFKNQNPIFVELGMGRGKFITTHAYNNPNINYIGMEVFNEVICNALDKVLALSLPNIALLPENIANIEEIFSEAEVDRLYINFCDPWPKARHAKRRLTHRTFLGRYQKILKPDGDIIFKTDSRELFDFSVSEFETAGLEITSLTYDLKNENDPTNIATEYEKKFMEMNMPIYRLTAKMKKD